jgi:hypothetical protein
MAHDRSEYITLLPHNGKWLIFRLLRVYSENIQRLPAAHLLRSGQT